MNKRERKYLPTTHSSKFHRAKFSNCKSLSELSIYGCEKGFSMSQYLKDHVKFLNKKIFVSIMIITTALRSAGGSLRITCSVNFCNFKRRMKNIFEQDKL